MNYLERLKIAAEKNPKTYGCYLTKSGQLSNNMLRGIILDVRKVHLNKKKGSNYNPYYSGN